MSQPKFDSEYHCPLSDIVNGLEEALRRLAAAESSGTRASFRASFEALAWIGSIRDRLRRDSQAIPPIVDALYYARNVVLHQGADVLGWIIMAGYPSDDLYPGSNVFPSESEPGWLDMAESIAYPRTGLEGWGRRVPPIARVEAGDSDIRTGARRASRARWRSERRALTPALIAPLGVGALRSPASRHRECSLLRRPERLHRVAASGDHASVVGAPIGWSIIGVRRHPSWEDPLAVVLVIDALAGAAAIIRVGNCAV